MDLSNTNDENITSVKRKPCRILHITDDFSASNTGVTTSVRQIAKWQSKYCDWVGVHATGIVDLPAPEGVTLLQVPAHCFASRWRYPAHGITGLLDIVREHGVTHLHIHEFWRGGYVVGMLAARVVTDVAVVLTVHGASSPWALYGQGWLKRLKKFTYWNFFARHLLLSRTVLHAITPLEQRHMQRFFGRKPQTIIPHGLNEMPDFKSLNAHGPVPDHRRLVFLGRLHPVKGLDLLLEAFHQAELSGDWELLIAGPEEIPAYAQKLKDIAKNGKRAEHIHFLGTRYGLEKWELLASAWVVVVSSRTEVIGMVNLEAASVGTPTITTEVTGLEGWTDSGGLLINGELSSLISALELVAGWSFNQRLKRGARSRRYVKNNFGMDVVGNRWLDFYDRLHNETKAVTR